MNPSSNLFLVGPSGAGKTSIGRRLADHYGLTFLDLDREIEEHTGVDVSTIFEIEGEAGFRHREAVILEECSRREQVLLATGAGAILDADSREHLRQRGFVIWLQASVDQQLKRLQYDRARPLLAGVDRRQRLRDMADRRNPLYAEIAELAIIGQNERVQRAFARCRTRIDEHWQRLQTSTT
ncbi:shikimate kinase [Oleiagrimonas soli]|uniref:Shikimate kinase n=1 Tax=Oleiagrimonas soli TaxID=1543381 RepID=A0A099CXY2_9GAMM|nr:shikimate kinase [Oleiagrimonas soli]KGI78609.1 shikimate kinase [Oleiagrimonas soli]MBB6184094.1 shikimate kinase [Oleiagrimonas soli]